MNKYALNFETTTVSPEEAETEDFKNLIKELEYTAHKYIGMQMCSANARELFTKVEQIKEEYQYSHPYSTFNIRPDHEYAYDSKYLTIEEIANLHKQYCEYHEEKIEYTNAEVNDMLFDLKVVKQINAYDSPAICYNMPFHNDKICTKESIWVNKRVFDY